MDMNTAADILKNLKKFDLNKDITKTLKSEKKFLLDMNRGQLMFGKTRMDEEVYPDYRSNAYAEWKNSKNSHPGFGTPDLYVTGAFQKAFTLSIEGDEMVFDSKDEKTAELVEKYSDEIFGLSEPTIEAAIDKKLNTAFINVVKKQIKL